MTDALEMNISLNGYSVSDALPPDEEWVNWAMTLAESYPEHARKVWEEHQKDVHENNTYLDKLSKMTREGYSGSRQYISAMNCITQDAFTRCSLPMPLGMDFKCAVLLTFDDPQYKAQMRAWRGYDMRVFGLIDFIEKHLILAGPAKEKRPIVLFQKLYSLRSIHGVFSSSALRQRLKLEGYKNKI